VTDHAQAVRDRRVLLLPPTPRDGVATCQLLAKAGIACDTVHTVPAMVRELSRGAGVLLLPEEAIAGTEVELLRVLAEQPPWSDLPILVMTRPGADSAYAAHAVRVLSNVTLLERPLQVAELEMPRTAVIAHTPQRHEITRDRSVNGHRNDHRVIGYMDDCIATAWSLPQTSRFSHLSSQWFPSSWTMLALFTNCTRS